MIPKIIHYCWFGHNPLPESAIKCIESWKKYLPDYEIKEWNEDNFDVNCIPYTAEAYAAKKYAFVSDYARFWILYKYGGIYFDTDVEIIKPLNEIIEKGPFMGLENNGKQGKSSPAVAPGLGLAASSGAGFIKELLEHYQTLHFEFKPGMIGQETIVHITTRLLEKYGLKPSNQIQKVADFYIYPSEYFCPINLTTNKLHITNKSVSIHHYAATWSDREPTWKDFLKKILPEWLLILINKLKEKC